MVFLQQQQGQQDKLRLAATRVKMIDRLGGEDLEIGGAWYVSGCGNESQKLMRERESINKKLADCRVGLIGKLPFYFPK
jgi:hypothetical protein